MFCRKIENNRKLSNHIDHGFVNHMFQLLVRHGMSFFDFFWSSFGVWCCLVRVWSLAIAWRLLCTHSAVHLPEPNRDAMEPGRPGPFKHNRLPPGRGRNALARRKNSPAENGWDWWFQSQMGTERTLPAGCAWVVKWPPKKKETFPQQNPL